MAVFSWNLWGQIPERQCALVQDFPEKTSVCAYRSMCGKWVEYGILIDYKPAGTSIAGEYYANVIKQLRVAIKEKRRGKLATGVLLLHDNAPVHPVNQSCTSGYS